MEIFLLIGIAAVTSAIVSKILATHYFKIVDGYVKKMCEMTMVSNTETLSTVRKLIQSFSQEE